MNGHLSLDAGDPISLTSAGWTDVAATVGTEAYHDAFIGRLHAASVDLDDALRCPAD